MTGSPPSVAPDVLRRQAREAPDRPALIVDRGAGEPNHPMTFAQWDRRSDGLAAALLERGLRKGERVALAFENVDAERFYVSYFAVAKAGGVSVPVGARLAEAEIGAILRHAEPSFAIGGDAQLEALRASVPAWRLWGPDDLDAAMLRDADPPSNPPLPGDLCDILYTSGTTGTPKGVCSTHAGLVTIRAGALKLFAGRAFVHAVPVHTFAGTHAMQYLPLRAGMTSVVMHRFDAARYIELLAAHRAAASYAVPAMLRLALDAWDARSPAGRPDLGPLALLMFGASAMPPSTLARLPELFPEAALVNLYASTETGSGSCAMPAGEAERHPGSVGVPVPPTEIRIVVASVAGSTQDAATGEVGEVWIRGPGPGRVYYKDPEATARTFVEEGWVRTGDLGHLDAEGYLYLDGRQKELVNRGGLKIFVDELDALLAAHPAVCEAAVAGIPHAVLGEDLAAFVVLRAGADVQPDDLRSYLLRSVADYKVPRHWGFIETLPRNSMGKVVRRELVARHSDALRLIGGSRD
ncbi:MAG TPA: class I adenylate-forming enzyme family protein [Myxococcales bacterium]|nr:class I adenylate-forming enzyme family protein [Myxococcales bacterium]